MQSIQKNAKNHFAKIFFAKAVKKTKRSSVPYVFLDLTKIMFPDISARFHYILSFTC